MWPFLKRRSHAGRQGRPCPKQFSVNAIARHPPTDEAHGQISHKGRRTTQVEFGIPGYAQFGESGSAETARSVKINTKPVVGTGRAVADVTVSDRPTI